MHAGFQHPDEGLTSWCAAATTSPRDSCQHLSQYLSQYLRTSPPSGLDQKCRPREPFGPRTRLNDRNLDGCLPFLNAIALAWTVGHVMRELLAPALLFLGSHLAILYLAMQMYAVGQ